MVLPNRAPSSVPVQYLGAGHLSRDANYHQPRHSHRCVEVLVIQHGMLSVHLDTEDVSLSTGDIIYYAPGVAHEEHIPEGQTADWFYVSWKPASAPPVSVVHDTNGRVRMLARWICEEVIAVSEYQREMMDAFTGALLAEVIHLAVNHTTDPLVLTVRKFLQKNLSQPLSVSDIAAQVHMSRAHFTRTYKRLTGLTPWDDLRRMRVEVARNLLVTTQLPLRVIAPQAGFSDEYHLSRAFRQYINVPPGYYRKHR